MFHTCSTNVPAIRSFHQTNFSTFPNKKGKIAPSIKSNIAFDTGGSRYFDYYDLFLLSEPLNNDDAAAAVSNDLQVLGQSHGDKSNDGEDGLKCAPYVSCKHPWRSSAGPRCGHRTPENTKEPATVVVVTRCWKYRKQMMKLLILLFIFCFLGMTTEKKRRVLKVPSTCATLFFCKLEDERRLWKGVEK